jgi:alpha-beta hydrolase superfamily lysophospholipase
MVKPDNTRYDPEPDRTERRIGADGATFAAHFWHAARPRGAILFLHGLAEHARRYAPFCRAATRAGYTVAANDYRGHGDTAPNLDALGQVGEDSWNATLSDSHQVLNALQSDHSDLPVFIVGYSIGVMLALRVAALAGSPPSGIVLIGGGGSSEPDYSMLVLTTQEEVALGRAARSQVQRLMFESFNHPFQPAATPFDWLSRDVNAVKAYCDDPQCGIPIATGFMVDHAAANIDAGKDSIDKLPVDMPVLILGGSQDSSAPPDAVKALADQLAAHNMHGVTTRFYPDARHDLLHETNAEEIYADILKWMAR